MPKAWHLVTLRASVVDKLIDERMNTDREVTPLMERAPGGLVGKPLPAQTPRQRDQSSREKWKKRDLP